MVVKKKRILVIGINCFPEITGIGRYTGEMLSWMVEKEHEVTMITSFPYYPQWEIQSPYSGTFYKKEVFHQGKLQLYRCPLYVPSHPTGLKRLIQEITFFFSAFLIIFRLLFKKKYDVTLCIAPPFHLGVLAMFYRFFKGTPIIYHIQDLQIDAARQLELLKPLWIFNILFKLEKWILNSVNLVSTISDGMLKKVRAKTKNRITFFPNWVDTKNFYPTYSVEDLKEQWGFLPTDKIILYSGSIGEKQGLDSLIRIAANLRKNMAIKFIICGTGPYKNILMEMAANEKLKNISFLPLQSNDVFNDFLNIADVHLVLQKGNASDLVMPSKLTTILSVGGLALVTANADTTLGEIIINNKMGLVIIPEDENELTEGILKCCYNDYSDERKNARKYAELNLSKDQIMERFEVEIDEVIEKS